MLCFNELDLCGLINTGATTHHVKKYWEKHVDSSYLGLTLGYVRKTVVVLSMELKQGELLGTRSCQSGVTVVRGDVPRLEPSSDLDCVFGDAAN
eukprot:scaffold28952_cov58-Attheya_sp.AAC.7